MTIVAGEYSNMAKKIYFRKCLSAITIIFIYCLVNSSFCECKQLQSCTSANDYDVANCENRDNERILSRKRRALTFPEGSSLQLGE